MIARLAAALVPLALALPAAAQIPKAQHLQPPGDYFVQLDGTVGVPIGDWSNNVSFPKTSQFLPGPGGRATIGFAPLSSRYFTVGLEAGYLHLDTSDWESFASRRGFSMDSGARMWSAAAGGTLSMPGRGRTPFAFELHGALGVLVPSGEDRIAGRTYDYEFLRSTLAGWIGARGVYRLSGSFDLWAGAEMLVAPGAVQHTADTPVLTEGGPRHQQRRTVTALEPGLGLRYWFGL